MCEAYAVHRETFYLAQDYFDRFLLVERNLKLGVLQLIVLTCLLIASKMEVKLLFSSFLFFLFVLNLKYKFLLLIPMFLFALWVSWWCKQGLKCHKVHLSGNQWWLSCLCVADLNCCCNSALLRFDCILHTYVASFHPLAIACCQIQQSERKG